MVGEIDCGTTKDFGVEVTLKLILTDSVKFYKILKREVILGYQTLKLQI